MSYIYGQLYKMTINRYQNMFSRKIAVFALVVSGMITVATSSCRREKDDDNIVSNETTAYAEEQLILEQIYANADVTVDRALTLGESHLKGGENPLGGCATISIDTTDNPDVQVMVIDFGGSKCLGFDGRYRKGKIIAYYAHKVKANQHGYYRRTEFSGYEVDGHKIGGYREMWYAGKNGGGNHYFKMASVDTIYLPNSSGKVTGASQREREWISGASTPQTADDLYRLTGFGNFTGPDGDKYYLEIVKPLVDAWNCNWITAGVTNIFPEGATQRVLDYGEGDCDNDATINVNGAKRIAKIP